MFRGVLSIFVVLQPLLLLWYLPKAWSLGLSRWMGRCQVEL